MGAIAFLYGLFAYTVFNVTFVYMIGFIGNLVVPKSIDSGSPPPIPEAVLINVALIGLFTVPHSVMARPAFKRRWTRLVPTSVERSTYVLLASLLLLLLVWQWRPLPELVWSVENEVARAVVYALFALGWVLALLSTYQIDHFDLLGLRQVYLRLRGRPYTPIPFKKPLLYGVVRHPLMFSIMLAFWAAPDMSQGRLLFAAGMTAYILVGTVFEERDLVQAIGDPYRQYQREVPSLLPWPRRRGRAA